MSTPVELAKKIRETLNDIRVLDRSEADTRDEALAALDVLEEKAASLDEIRLWPRRPEMRRRSK